MRYLIITTDPSSGKHMVFYTDWYSEENCFTNKLNMIVVDRRNNCITFDGKTWQKIEGDNL